MNTLVKLILSIALIFIGFLLGGLFPGLLGAFLFISSIIGIVAIWRNKKIENEGDIFKNHDKLNKN